jgi:hypothetical protein
LRGYVSSFSLGSIAQHGSFDDQIYFTASANAGQVGTNSFTSAAAVAPPIAGGGKGATTSASVSVSTTAAVPAAKASGTPAVPAAGAPGAQTNLQKFTGTLGGSPATPILSECPVVQVTCCVLNADRSLSSLRPQGRSVHRCGQLFHVSSNRTAKFVLDPGSSGSLSVSLLACLNRLCSLIA